ncbi:Flp family type IVb pilin [Salinisphaera sp. T31B1]|uniref:Flp family type IVb pilin n=1 Tax=Salinisphaera sp. T31B1 TaxID=727963 RepID=UPI00333E45B3
MRICEFLLYWINFSQFGSKERGATLIEYVLIVAVIAVAVFAASQAGLVSAIQGVFTDAQDCIGGTCS